MPLSLLLPGRPAPADASPFHFTYIDRIESEDILSILSHQCTEAHACFESYAEEASLHRYAPDKWSVREVLNHITDTERIFAFRALWFARGLPGALASFDQQIAVDHAAADRIPFSRHKEEFTQVRQATLSLFRNLPPEAWSRAGVASDHRFTVLALAFTIAGHLDHHLALLRERYPPADALPISASKMEY